MLVKGRFAFVARRRRGRQDHLDVGSLPCLARDLKRAARLFNDAGDHRQAQTGAFTGLLGREERLGDPLDKLGWNSVALVRDPNSQKRALLARIVDDVFLSDRYNDPSTVGHRIPRVDQQVDERKLELRLVDEEVRRALRDLPIDRHETAQGVFNQPSNRLAQLYGGDAGRREFLLARERHQAADKLGAALRRMAHMLEDVLLAIPECDPAFEQPQTAENRSQQIVEIVRNTSGELPERFRLTGLNELFLQGVLGRHVHQRANPVFSTVRRWRTLVDYPDDFAVPTLPPIMQGRRA